MLGDDLYLQEHDKMIHEINVFDLKDYFKAEYYLNSTGYLVKYCKDVAVFVHLYYSDILDFCYSFIKEIVKICDVFVTTSNIDIKKKLEKKIQYGKILNCKIRLVENRGRDVAALTVHSCDLAKKYKYFCFVHDKKSVHLHSEESGRYWLQTLWENTLASPEYVLQIIECFEEHERLGILSVPEPYWGEFISIVGNAWCNNYIDVVNLSQRLKLNCVLSYEKPPITIGTAFWAKTDALKPLLDYSFLLDDFPENGVGAISYAVERILPYVAQSQGYYTGIVATKEYAVKRSIYMQNAMANTVSILRHRYGWNDLKQINNIVKIYEKVDGLMVNYTFLYIYGIGRTSVELIRRYPAIVNKIRGFVVSKGKRVNDFFKEKKIYELEEICDYRKSAFIIAVQEKLLGEIIDQLRNKEVTEHQIFLAEDLIKAID